MRSQMSTRPLAAFAACVSAALLLASCGGGGGGGGGAIIDTTPAAALPEALRAAQPGELVAYYKSRLVERGTRVPTQQVPVPSAPGAIVTGSLAEGGFSGTQLQEAGVDEDDLLKTDGRFIYALHPAYWSAGGMVPGRLETRRIQPGGSLGGSASVPLDAQSWSRGMYLAGDARRLAVLGQKSQQLSLDMYDVSDEGQPAHSTQVLIDGYTVGSRRIGNVLYVATAWHPDLSRFAAPYGASLAQAEAAAAGLNAGALLPKIRVGNNPAQPLVTEQDCQIQPANASLSLQLTTITAIDLSTPALERRSRCFIGGGEALYMSASAVYLASSRNYWLGGGLWEGFPAEATTDIHKFALQGLEIDYRGSAEVTGHLGWDAEKMPYRMSEYQGDLRVITFTGSTGWIGGGVIAFANASTTQAGSATTTTTPPSPAKLTVLREDPAQGRLARIATLPNSQRPAPIGHEGEQVYAVRFAGPIGYVVTFRQTDPLYVLDLSDPADPKTAGELSMPGFSDYLFPLANGKLLGVGKDATAEGLLQGLKIALFDVSNPAQPRLVSSRSLGERGSTSALDSTRHGINILQEGARARIALPVRLAATGSNGRTAIQQGLARFVVDTAAGTLEERPMVPATGFHDGSPDIHDRLGVWNERSIQSANATYYLSGGAVGYTAEPLASDVPFARLGGNFYGDWPVQNHVARTQAQWSQIWDQHDPMQSPTPEKPVVDFSAHTVVGVSMGWGPSGCDGVEIVRIAQEPGQLRVVYRRTIVPPMVACTTAMVPLITFVTIPATAEPVVFELAQ